MDWKELLKTFVESLTTALGEAGDDDAKKAVLKAATDQLPSDARNYLTQIGFSAAHAQGDEKITALKKELTAAEKAKERAESKLKETLDKTPDVASIRTEYETKMTELIEDHKKEIEAVSGELGGAIQEMALTQLEAALVGQKVKPMIARYRVRDADVRNRVKVDGKEIKFYLPDGITPMAPPTEGKSPYQALASELVKTIDPEFVGSGVGGGSGAGSGSGAGTNGIAKVVKEHIDAIEKAKAERPNPLLKK